jgi:hypothetical protein
MSRTWVGAAVMLNAGAVLCLAWVYPDLMVSPGPLQPAHAGLARDCSACHVAWRGAAAAQCATCHVAEQIGVVTTRGAPLAPGTTRVAFHQQLTEPDCIACHSDHPGTARVPRSKHPFSHGLLNQGIRAQCASCHEAPHTRVHENKQVGCLTCHTSGAWKPAVFVHTALAPAVLERCESCHTAPEDGLHPKVTGRCQSCHQTGHWKPATFEHQKFFVLEGVHAAACSTCHKGTSYSDYTCYGCHAHTPENIRREHREVRGNLEKCARCHTSAGGEGGEGGGEED